MNTFMRKLGVLATTLSVALSASAYDFEVDGIYYNITDSYANEVEVTEGSSYGGYSGDIVVPPSVSYDGNLYSVTSIGREAFSDCSSLTSITIPNSVTSIGYEAFSLCGSLTSISIPNSVTSIGNYAFSGCSSLTSITLPNSVTSIEDMAFSGCSSLTSISIPNSVTSIGIGAFRWCYSLTSIDVDVDNEAYSSNNGILYDKLQTTLICWPGGKSEEVIIPNSVTSIEDMAFSGCSSLASITLPNSVTSIGYWAFSGCSSLTSINIPNSVTSIGIAFSGCSSLTSIDVDVDNEAYSSKNGILYDKLQTTLICCPRGKSEEIIIPNSVTTIWNYAFYGCSSLTSITLPNSVTSIGNSAFYYCSSLTSINIPNSVTSIGNSAFYYCSSLTSINIPNSVTAIGNEVFWGCSSLTSITIPNSVTSIGEDAFRWCYSLTSIDVDVDNEAYSSNDGILYDKSQTTLICCPGGKSEEVIIPNSVTSIGNDAFSDCSSLTSITIPNSVTTIGDWAFYCCWSLTSITIPNSVTSIGDWAFGSCSSLTSITSLAVTPPECGEEVFDNVTKQKCTLYVPAESVEAYKQAPGWKDFVLVEAVAGEAAGIDSVAAGTADGATEVFNLTGAKVADSLENLPAGIYLVHKGSTIRKIAVR